MDNSSHHSKQRSKASKFAGLLWSWLSCSSLFYCLAILALAGQTLGAPCHASCDPSITRYAGGAYPYKQRGVRCEGTYASLCAGQAPLELISLTRGAIKYQFAPSTTLVVAPELGGLAPEPVHVRAVARPVSIYYRMDTVVEKTSFNWPVGDVLFPLGLHEKRIGLYGWIEKKDDRIYVPLRVVAEHGEPTGKDIQVIVRARVDVEHVKWRYREQRQPVVEYSEPHETAQKVVAGDTVVIKLPGEGKPAILEVEVDATTGSGGTTKLRFSVAR